MSTPYATAQDFREALLDAGLLAVTGVDGLYHRSGAFEEIALGVGRHAASQRTEPSDAIRWFPPILPRTDFLLTDYLRSFPDLVGSIDIFTGNDRDHRALLEKLDAGEDWTALLEPAEVAMASSACHPLYGTLPNDISDDGLVVECCGFVFRHEPSTDPARMQSFRQYEFVRIGTPEQALAHRDAWLERGATALRNLGLDVRTEPANDPFFGRLGGMLATNQLDSALKFEILADVTDSGPTALASTNYHEDHFGHPFSLKTPNGEHAHTACIGFGLERITLALLSTHGLDPSAWPAAVRQSLSLPQGQ